MRLTMEEKKPFGTFFKGKLKRIALPYVGYGLIYILLEILRAGFLGGSSFNDVWLTIYNLLCFNGVSVLWFLPAMFFAVMLFYFLRKLPHCITAILVMVITVLMFVAAYYLNIYNAVYGIFPTMYYLNSVLSMLIRSFMSVFYLAIGYYAYFLQQLFLEKNKNPNKYISAAEVIAAIFLLILVWHLAQKNGVVDLHILVFGNNWLYLLNSVLGSLAVIMISRNLELFVDTFIGRVLCFWGKNSLTIMATHMDWYIMYVCLVVTLHFAKVCNNYSSGFVAGMALILVLIAEAALIYVMSLFKRIVKRDS